MNSPAMKHSADVLLEARHVKRTFDETGETLEVLKGVDFTMQAGEMVALTGVSGAGKSTFLNIIGALDRPTSGEILFRGENLAQKSEKELDRYRSRHVGFVFQFHHLLPEFSALENVMLPARIAGLDNPKARAEELLAEVGLENRLTHLPRELSGGERQRAAVARALVNRPDLVLADEPSGNLDESNSRALHELFRKLNEKWGQAFLIVTHDSHLASQADRQVGMSNGLVDLPGNQATTSS